ncbi:hypothetical protein FRC04_005116 [Tulasnella sp. 424]|nr:hypothetical protein FRC04_005116 [Tulasnella sp. 424]
MLHGVKSASANARSLATRRGPKRLFDESEEGGGGGGSGSYGRAESKRSKGCDDEADRFKTQRGDAAEGREEEDGEGDGEGDDDERAEKEVSATSLPPGLAASQLAEDNDEEEDDDEDDGADIPDSTSTSRSTSLSLPSLSTRPDDPSWSTITPSKMTRRQRKVAAKAGSMLPPRKPKRVTPLVGEKKKNQDAGAGGESDAAKEAVRVKEERSGW